MAEKIAQWNRHGRLVCSVPVHAQVQRAHEAGFAGMKGHPDASHGAGSPDIEQGLRLASPHRLGRAPLPSGIGPASSTLGGGGIFKTGPTGQVAGAGPVDRQDVSRLAGGGDGHGVVAGREEEDGGKQAKTKQSRCFHGRERAVVLRSLMKRGGGDLRRIATHS